MGAIRVLVVDDSRTARLALSRILERHPDTFAIEGLAADAGDALVLVERTQPDLVLMDVHLGGDDGVDLSREILQRARTRVVVVTAVSPDDPALHFRALTAGALEVLAKPRATAGEESFDVSRFVRALRALATVPLLRSRPARARRRSSPPPPAASRGSEPVQSRRIARVLLGASTGGPPLLQSLLIAVPPPLSVPWVIVQHISDGFGEGFARWLTESTGHPVRYCDAPLKVGPSDVCIASDDAHLHFLGPDLVGPGRAPKDRTATPSVDELFLSATSHDPCATLAVLLTGMGSDGAEGLLALRSAGAATVAQSPSTCLVGSMPSAAIERNAARHVVDPNGLVDILKRLPAAPR